MGQWLPRMGLPTMGIEVLPRETLIDNALDKGHFHELTP